jgi:hypothetical protein
MRWKQEVPDCLQSSPFHTLLRKYNASFNPSQKGGNTCTKTCCHLHHTYHGTSVYTHFMVVVTNVSTVCRIELPPTFPSNGTSKYLYQQTPVKKKLWSSVGRHEPSSASNTLQTETYSYAPPNLARTFLSSVMTGTLTATNTPALHYRLIFHKSY